MEEHAQKTKKHRKRGKKAESQPPPKRIRAKDDVVPAREDGLPRIHIAGEAIPTPELLRLAGGHMLALSDSIKTLEGILLKDKDPNYPVFTVKVPSDVDFVHEAPADVFFISYEDVFKLFLSKRLDYNMARLFVLNLAMKTKREQTPYIAIVDPYYMRDSQLREGSKTRAKVTTYLEKFMVDHKRTNTLLLPFFPK